MKTFCYFLLSGLLIAHPDADTIVKNDAPAGIITGNGAWTYETVSDWGVLPEGKLIGPTHGSILSGKDGKFYLSTDADLSVIVYDQDGKFLKSIAPECKGFHAMALRVEEGKEVIYGAHLPAKRVCKIDTDGKILLTIPNENTVNIEGGWNGVTAATVADDGSIYVAMGYGSCYIHKFDATGKHLLTFGGKKVFKKCHGIALDKRYGEPRLLIADRENRRLVHTDMNGKIIDTYAKNLRRPCMVDFFGEYCAVAELESRVTILDKNGTPVAFLGDNPDNKQWANFKVPLAEMHDGIFTAPHGLCFDTLGNLYVQDWNQSGRVTKLKKIK